MSSLPLGALRLPVLALLSAAPLAAQGVQGLQAAHAAGQTFVTWQEDPTALSYRVWRSASLLDQASDLDAATLLAEVLPGSGLNLRRSLSEGTPAPWVVPVRGALPAGTGLFVHTVAADADAFYAVTPVRASGEDRTLVPGANSLAQAVPERAAPPEPWLQASGPGGETWAHWVSNRPTPFQEAMALEPGQGFNFLIRRGTTLLDHGLVVILHPRNSVYGQLARPFQGYDFPDDLGQLHPDDPFPDPGNTFWYGARTDFPEPADAGDLVDGFTLRRVLWELDWTLRYLADETDPERVYAIGNSMGAIGVMRLVEERPELFAAVLVRFGLFDFAAPDAREGEVFADLWGPSGLDLPDSSGLPAWNRLSSIVQTGAAPAEDWPLIVTVHGRRDATVGWSHVPPFLEAMRAAWRPGVHYWDESTHAGGGLWDAQVPVLLDRLWAWRNDRPQLFFADLSLNQDPGNGDPADGDPTGQWNATVDFDPAEAVEDADSARFLLRLRQEGALDDARAPSATLRLCPRRLQRFRIQPGEAVRFRWETEDGLLVAEEVLVADARGHVLTSPVVLGTEPRRAVFEHDPGLDAPFLGGPDSATPGSTLRLGIEGDPGEGWRLFASLDLGISPVPGGSLDLAAPRLLASGVLDTLGRAMLRQAVPDRPSLRGRTVWLQAWSGGRTSNLHTIRIQD